MTRSDVDKRQPSRLRKPLMLSNLLLNITRRWPLQEQMQEVLDAMFERTVDSGDYVIRQGVDGDNFYVIDRSVVGSHVSVAGTCQR